MIWTSNFARTAQLHKAGIVPIGIAIKPPHWYKGLHYRQLMPLPTVFKIADQQRYEAAYLDQLSDLDPFEVLEDLRILAGGKGCAILCFERAGEFCHRRLVARWLLEQTAVVIEEWVPPAPPPPAQQSLF